MAGGGHLGDEEGGTERWRRTGKGEGKEGETGRENRTGPREGKEEGEERENRTGPRAERRGGTGRKGMMKESQASQIQWLSHP